VFDLAQTTVEISGLIVSPNNPADRKTYSKTAGDVVVPNPAADGAKQVSVLNWYKER
jgi:hypothetical protein